MARVPLRGPRPVDERGRLTLPRDALEALGLPEGGYVEIEKGRSGAITLRAVSWKQRRD